MTWFALFVLGCRRSLRCSFLICCLNWGQMDANSKFLIFSRSYRGVIFGCISLLWQHSPGDEGLTTAAVSSPGWCSALFPDTTASLNLNVCFSGVAAQDKANQHHMPWGWTYSLALEFLTLAGLFINFSCTNPRVLLLQNHSRAGQWCIGPRRRGRGAEVCERILIRLHIMRCFVFRRKKKKGRKVINALSPYLAPATYLVCLKRYLLNSAQALRSRIMITVHLDKLHSDNPFVKIWIQLEAEGEMLHLFCILPQTITASAKCACVATQAEVSP